MDVVISLTLALKPVQARVFPVEKVRTDLDVGPLKIRSSWDTPIRIRNFIQRTHSLTTQWRDLMSIKTKINLLYYIFLIRHLIILFMPGLRILLSTVVNIKSAGMKFESSDLRE